MSSEAVVETLLWLLSVPSLIGEEKALCDAVALRLAPRAAAPIRRVMNSIVVPLSRGTGGPKIALVGHLDVVATRHDGPPRVEGDRIFGAGSADMKSGLAVMIDVAEDPGPWLTKVDLTLVFYSREEGPFAENELGPLLDADTELRAIDLAVCFEPSDNWLSLGASGSIHAALLFEGKTAHSARPWQGVNAIHKAGPLLCRLAALAPRDVTLDGLVYRTVTSITLASGGRGRNVVPDRFTLNLNHRFSPDQSLSQAQREIEALVAHEAVIEWRDLSPGAPPFRDHPLVRSLEAAGAVGVMAKQAWTDVARFATLGIAAINFGPGDNAQAHQENESTSARGLALGRTITRRWLSSL